MGKQFVRHTHTHKGLVEWLKVALSSSPSTAKQKQKQKRVTSGFI
jgi:hypothetical protein